jgi:CRP-like cAMP-binding protein
LFKDVADDVLGDVFSVLKSNHYNNRATILLDRDFQDRVGFIWSGDYRFCATTPNGGSVTLYPVKPRDAFGYAMALAGMRYGDVHRVCVDRGGVVLAMPTDFLLSLQDRSDAFAKNLNTSLTRLTLRYGARLYELSCSNVRVRLQAELIRYADQMGGAGDRRALAPSPTHATLADLVGATREGVTRHLHAMQDDGVIEINHGKITIVSLRALRALDETALGHRFFLSAQDES